METQISTFAIGSYNVQAYLESSPITPSIALGNERGEEFQAIVELSEYFPFHKQE